MIRIATAAAAFVLIAVVRANGSPAPLTKPLPPVLNVTTSDLPKTPTAAVQIRTGQLAAGAATIWHVHPSPPFVYVESGAGEWEYKGGLSSQLRRAGQAIMEPANVPMRVVNRATTPLRLVIFQVSKPGEPVLQPAP